MSDPSYFTSDEVLALLDLQSIITHQKDGVVQFEQAGLIGTGQTVPEAKADWGRKFSVMISRPKGSPQS